MIEFDRDDLVAYLIKKSGVSLKDLSKEVREKFASYQEFQDFLK